MRNSLFILGPLSDDDIEWMIAYGEKQTVARGDILIRQDHPAEDLYLTLSGVFGVTDDRAGGLELARLGSGEILGEMSFVDANPPSATVSAIEDGMVLALSKKLLRQRLDQDTAFAARFYFALAVFLSDRLRAMESKIRGSGEHSLTGADAAVEEGELDLNVLDNLHLAGARFKYIVDRLAQT
jgi:CRP-like cAMP-binding protein